MQSIHGNFAIHRTKTVDGKNAILLVPYAHLDSQIIVSLDDSKDDSAEVYFEDVQGGESLPNEYLTLVYPGDYTLCLGPYVPTIGTN
jgi:hypothetical protein